LWKIGLVSSNDIGVSYAFEHADRPVLCQVYKCRWLRRLRSFGIALAGLLGIFYALGWWLSEVPAMRYVATCGPDMFDRVYVEGPYNDQFLHLLESAISGEDFIYVRKGQEIYVPYWGLSGPLVNGYILYENYHDFSLNVDWKLVAGIARGIKIDGVDMPPPQPLLDLIKATEHKYGAYSERSPTGEYVYGIDERFHASEDACAFMRAAILPDSAQVEPAVRSTDRSGAP
jgi:hypothetical protein